MPAFHHLTNAQLDQLVRRQPVDAPALELDRPLGDVAPFGAQQIGDCFERRSLARTVGSEQRGDPALRHFERYALEHEDDVVVDDLDVVDRKVRLGHARRCGRRGVCRCGHGSESWLRAGQTHLSLSQRRGEGRECRKLVAQASLPQSRGVMPFSLAYAAADCSTIDRTSSRSGWIQSVITFHCLPSHCWNLTAPPPSWSAQVTFSDCMNPAAPSSLRRASLICRFSMPKRICSPVI